MADRVRWVEIGQLVALRRVRDAGLGHVIGELHVGLRRYPADRQRQRGGMDVQAARDRLETAQCGLGVAGDYGNRSENVEALKAGKAKPEIRDTSGPRHWPPGRRYGRHRSDRNLHRDRHSAEVGP